MGSKSDARDEPKKPLPPATTSLFAAILQLNQFQPIKEREREHEPFMKQEYGKLRHAVTASRAI